MRGTICIGLVALASGGWLPAALAQMANSPLYQLAPGGQGVQGMPGNGSAPAEKYPHDRNPALDNRAPAVAPLSADWRDSTLRLDSPLENGQRGNAVRRPEGLQAPMPRGEPGRPAWRY